MSMNLYIFAEREVTFKDKAGKICKDTQTITFRALQTPTKVTYKILANSEPAQAYIDWVFSISEYEVLPVYAEDDIFGENEAVDSKVYNAGLEHIVQFSEFLDNAEADGYVVKFEMI